MHGIKLDLLQGNGTSSLPNNYEFIDRNLLTGRYKYRLKQIDYNGNFEYYDLQNEVVIGIPEKYSLSQNYPNPFNPVTILEFGISKRGFVSLKVYDLLGKEVVTLVNSDLNPGTYKYSFNASVLGSGLYIYKLAVDGSIIDSKRMMLLK